MTNLLPTALMLASSLFAAPVAFDQAVDVKAVMREAGVNPDHLHKAGFGRHLYWLSSCEKKTLQPGQTQAGPFKLHSVEMVEECDIVMPGGGMNCRRTFGQSVYRPNVRLVLNNRPANEVETFEVCLTGPQLHVPLIVSPARYEISVSGSDVVLTAK